MSRVSSPPSSPQVSRAAEPAVRAVVPAPIPRWAGVAAMLLIAAAFGSNHVAARLAFDHGVNVPTAVVVRSAVTAITVLALLRLAGVPVAVAGPVRARALVIGLLISVQSYCLYSSVARIPVALALLAFNTFPFLLGLISWLAGGERPTRRTLTAMPVALVGLALALDVAGRLGSTGGGMAEDLARRWAQIGTGVSFALAGSLAFATTLYLTTRWLPAVDGRLRTFMFMSVTAVVVAVAASLGPGFALPHDAPGWAGLALLTVLYGSAITGLFVVLPRLGAVNNAAIMNFEPVASLVVGWLVLGQTIAPLQMLGGAIVIGAIVWLTTGRR